jgi:hypothetical protein
VVVISDDEPGEKEHETSIPRARRIPKPIVGEYLLNAKTLVGVQVVYRDSRSTIEGLWSCKRYFDESAHKVQKAGNDRAVDPVLLTSTATVYSKAMKLSEYITCDVHEPMDWFHVESIVNHLAKSLSKGIRVDFIMKYSARHIKDHSDDGKVSDSSEDENPAPTKCPRKVRSILDFLMNRLLHRSFWMRWKLARQNVRPPTSLNS